MTRQQTGSVPAAPEHWLKRYYFMRAAFSITWIIAVLTIAQSSAMAGAILLVGYPVWDAVANYLDSKRSGGLAANRTQLLNVVVSIVVALLLAVTWPNMHGVLAVFGAWAILSGLLQLGTAMRRWKNHGAQWAMALSGAQSALAGAFFIFQARMPAEPTVASLVGYAGFGAFYFLASALSLSVVGRRKRP
ncbi:DUF308 domain-containing protein [Pseudoduganella umbonata]|uniref:DUF308 domain-containing protein n=1 Tax=Pseudoduganella umbonata TaxID=864828 RepID=A0A4P8HQL2_9BURK|nr:DUF308 domain-containing protein [Pseudoduganella umbonata]MBB3220375.1 hypothetical protein [Pseudoduganella umbonata]QCP12089.1 DUF308 domain-containing protein [Pseudoduganella umbonata]